MDLYGRKEQLNHWFILFVDFWDLVWCPERMSDIQDGIEDSLESGSNWEGFLQAIGILTLSCSILIVIIKGVFELRETPLESLEEYGLGNCLLGVIGGIMFIFFGFVVSLLTDIRWFLAKLYSNSLKTNEYLDYQFRMKQ